MAAPFPPSPSLNLPGLPPNSSPSLFANANNFHLQNLNYYQVSSPSRSETGWKLLLEHTTPSALYDSRARFDPPKVDKHTRVEVMERLTTWIEDRESPTRLLCMTGAAGAGKSALQQTIAERYAESGALAASFFFSCSDPSRNNVSAIVPSIAYQLGLRHPYLRQWIGEAVDDDHLVFSKSLRTQMDALVVRPVEHFRAQMGPAKFSSLPYLITIDALDECLDDQHQADLLSVIHTSLLRDNMPFRIFLASRPELTIRTALESYPQGFVYHLRLSDDFDATDDIRKALWRRLREIGARSSDPLARSPLWPTHDDVESLVIASSGQFVYAATVIRYVSDRRGSPVKRLQMVLEGRHGEAPANERLFAELDLLYMSILSNAKEAWEVANPDSPYDFVVLLRIFECYRCSDFPLSSFLVTRRYHESNDFCHLLGLDSNTLDTLTLDLRSLVSVVDKNGSGETYDTLHLYHRSFVEFLDTPTRSKGLYRSTVLVTEFIVSCLMRQICHGLDPDAIEGAIQSLPSTTWWMIDMESRLETSEAYEISQSLYDAFLRFTRDQGWDKFFTTWVAGEWYTGQHSPIGHAIEGGLVRLLALVMEYAKLKDLDREWIFTIGTHHANLCQQIAPFVALEKREMSKRSDFEVLPFNVGDSEFDDDDNV
ncbi:hypothetical protein FA13DRAFT_1792210 [Coprinellus micaceus]|uniref:Nephrocystin 3-like N-terminal domain-containing protein n=1 Tax=Coprinellus micaceus TaxID=71717 RepID=A0A4Y7T8Z5_COPMI|nr:hypothetical protein FA13DRAFT_1792210 [Coprinellus micaceus]